MNKIRGLVLAVTACATIFHPTSSHALAISVLATAPTDGVLMSNSGKTTSGAYSRTYNFPGQTITTTSSIIVDGLVLYIANVQGSLANQTWTLDLGTVTSNTFTSVDSETLVTSTDFASGTKHDYLQFQLSAPITLAASTVYGLDVSVTGSSSTDYVEFGASPNTDYAGGSAFELNGTTVTTQNHDLTFYVVGVPEPANWAIIPVLATVAALSLRRMCRAG